MQPLYTWDAALHQAKTQIGENGLTRLQTMYFEAKNQVSGAYPILSFILPPKDKMSYSAGASVLSIHPTVAEPTALSSPYAKGGYALVGDTSQQTYKYTVQTLLEENFLRELQDLIVHSLARGNDGAVQDFLFNKLIDFYDTVILTPQFQTWEFAGTKSIFDGAQTWDANGVHVKIDHRYAAERVLAPRTGADAWDKASSKFWDDWNLLHDALDTPPSLLMAGNKTARAFLYNSANNITITKEIRPAGAQYVIYEFYRHNKNQQRIDGVRAAGRLLGLNNRATFKTETGGNEVRWFAPEGKLVALADYTQGVAFGASDIDGFGITHVGPTIENFGAAGMFGELFQPQNEPYTIKGRSVSNFAPVLRSNRMVCVAQSEIDGQAAGFHRSATIETEALGNSPT